MLSQKRIEQLITDKQEYLNMLADFDRTGKLKKINYKERVTFTIDEDLMIDFRKSCEEKNVSMSSVVEKLIKENMKKK